MRMYSQKKKQPQQSTCKLLSKQRKKKKRPKSNVNKLFSSNQQDNTLPLVATKKKLYLGANTHSIRDTVREMRRKIKFII